MLTILIHNDGTGTQKSANYDYEVHVNFKTIAKGRVEGHNRANSWTVLVEMLIEDHRLHLMGKPDED
jgi:hypothetical protein